MTDIKDMAAPLTDDELRLIFGFDKSADVGYAQVERYRSALIEEGLVHAADSTSDDMRIWPALGITRRDIKAALDRMAVYDMMTAFKAAGRRGMTEEEMEPLCLINDRAFDFILNCLLVTDTSSSTRKCGA